MEAAEVEGLEVDRPPERPTMVQNYLRKTFDLFKVPEEQLHLLEDSTFIELAATLCLDPGLSSVPSSEDLIEVNKKLADLSFQSPDVTEAGQPNLPPAVRSINPKIVNVFTCSAFKLLLHKSQEKDLQVLGMTDLQNLNGANEAIADPKYGKKVGDWYLQEVFTRLKGACTELLTSGGGIGELFRLSGADEAVGVYFPQGQTGLDVARTMTSRLKSNIAHNLADLFIPIGGNKPGEAKVMQGAIHFTDADADVIKRLKDRFPLLNTAGMSHEARWERLVKYNDKFRNWITSDQVEVMEIFENLIFDERWEGMKQELEDAKIKVQAFINGKDFIQAAEGKDYSLAVFTVPAALKLSNMASSEAGDQQLQEAIKLYIKSMSNLRNHDGQEFTVLQRGDLLFVLGDFDPKRAEIFEPLEEGQRITFETKKTKQNKDFEVPLVEIGVAERIGSNNVGVMMGDLAEKAGWRIMQALESFETMPFDKKRLVFARFLAHYFYDTLPNEDPNKRSQLRIRKNIGEFTEAEKERFLALCKMFFNRLRITDEAQDSDEKKKETKAMLATSFLSGLKILTHERVQLYNQKDKVS